MRIGHGYDLHRLEAGRPLVLGGIRIDHDYGPLAHSDGDVALHALCDALLGAAALGDIGQIFPDTDPAHAGADSRELLREVRDRVAAAGYAPHNIDITIIAERPKLAPHIPAMRETLSGLLALPLSAVSIKAKTSEGVGPIGFHQAIAAHAICLISER